MQDHRSGTDIEQIIPDENTELLLMRRTQAGDTNHRSMWYSLYLRISQFIFGNNNNQVKVNDSSAENYFNKLSDEIVLIILSYLDFKSLYRLSLVDERMYRITKDKILQFPKLIKIPQENNEQDTSVKIFVGLDENSKGKFKIIQEVSSDIKRTRQNKDCLESSEGAVLCGFIGGICMGGVGFVSFLVSIMALPKLIGWPAAIATGIGFGMFSLPGVYIAYKSKDML